MERASHRFDARGGREWQAEDLLDSLQVPALAGSSAPCPPRDRQIHLQHDGQLFEDAKEVIKSLKSRGVTRFEDLTIQNKQNIYDIDTDEEVLDDLESDLEPPTQRRSLLDPNFTRASPAQSLDILGLLAFCWS